MNLIDFCNLRKKNYTLLDVKAVVLQLIFCVTYTTCLKGHFQEWQRNTCRERLQSV